MTVSPRWPQDDAEQSSDVGDRVAADNGDPRNMPPTLFRLPNLNSAPVTPDPAFIEPIAESDIASTPSSGAPSAEPAPTAYPTISPLDISPAAADAAAKEVHANQTPLPEQSIPARSFPEASVPASDTPAGRSWMEVTGQNGVVVLLLMIVVATAIFTGRDTSTDLSDVAIADALDIDQTDPGVPIPAHDHDLSIGVASSQQTSLPDPNDIGSIEPNTDAVAKTADPSPSFASLEPPHVNAPPVAAQRNLDPSTFGAFDTNVSIDKTAANEFGVPQVDAKTVANRVDEATDFDSDVAFNPPSLESLADSLFEDESTLGSESSGIQANSFAPVFSKTPVGISDWLKFLPAPPNATSN